MSDKLLTPREFDKVVFADEKLKSKEGLRIAILSAIAEYSRLYHHAKELEKRMERKGSQAEYLGEQLEKEKGER